MLSMPAVASRAARSVCALSLHSRRLATQVPANTGSSSSLATNGPLRPHLHIPVNPNHGLYAFFRKKEKDGKTYYDTVESADMTGDKSGAFVTCRSTVELADGLRVTSDSLQVARGRLQNSGERASRTCTLCGTLCFASGICWRHSRRRLGDSARTSRLSVCGRRRSGYVSPLVFI